jgi:hypothetical protein
VTLKTYFSHPSLVIYYLATLPIKLKLGVQQIGGGLLIANHAEPIIMMGQSETLNSTQINLLHSFHGSQSFCAFCQPPQKLCNYVEPKNYFSEPNLHFLTFLHPIVLWVIT